MVALVKIAVQLLADAAWLAILLLRSTQSMQAENFISSAAVGSVEGEARRDSATRCADQASAYSAFEGIGGSAAPRHFRNFNSEDVS
jgi:hypothetical protein